VPEHHAERTFTADKRNSLLTRLPVILLVLAFVFVSFPSHSQTQDTVKVKSKAEKPHSIGKAAIFSAALPGLGQVYNRKAWKVPIIYAGFGVLGYMIYAYNGEYQVYKEAYVWVANGSVDTIDNPYAYKYNQSQLQSGMDFYRRNRDLSIIVTSLWYVLNILEAYVDAHFFDYDISEDISLRISPAATPTSFTRTNVTPGLKITLKF
jgi:hypothetical protein